MSNLVNLLTAATVVAIIVGAYLLARTLLYKFRQERRLNKIAPAFKDEKKAAKKTLAFNKKRKSKKTEIKLLAKLPLFGDLYKACLVFNLPILTPLAFAIPFVIGFFMQSYLPLNYMPFWIKFTYASLVAAFFCGRLAMFMAKKYAAKLDNNTPVLLDAITRGLRVGKSFTAVLGSVGDELEGPMKSIIRDIKNGLEVGVDPVEIFTEYGDSTGVQSFHFIAALLAANQKSGGSMAPAFESLANTIRANKELVIKIEAMSAESKFAGYAMASLPFIFVWFLSKSTPEMTTNLWNTAIGNFTFIGITFVVYIALLIMQRISRIKT